MPLPSSVSLNEFTLPRGFDAAGVACGLKVSGRPDVALLVAGREWSAAGVFTTNRVVAAPVDWDRAVLEAGAGRVKALIANSGCANACTGTAGAADTRRTASHVASALGCTAEQVLVLSTGVIGAPLDMDKLTRGIDDAFARLGAPAGGTGGETRHAGAVRAIMTTDTVAKTAAAEMVLDGKPVAIRGFAKGAGMIHPGMATMLAVVTTDAEVEPARLHTLLSTACARSFNRVTVDGDMSTNDTLLLLASGESGARVEGASEAVFAAGLTEVCVSLARQIAADGEGATRLVEVTVAGAGTEADAHRVADAIARSPLFKTAVHGGDPNWGRVLAAAGSCGVGFDPAAVSLVFGEGAAAIQVVREGMRASYLETEAAARLRENPVAVRLNLGTGGHEATVWTCDFSAAYVSINADYTT
ncbi:MAG: bifunctional glutamate N-acetyltransferase/amino-acid acetyltransferase ArgJ [Candidatus Eisenbacteria bacterium]